MHTPLQPNNSQEYWIELVKYGPSPQDVDVSFWPFYSKPACEDKTCRNIFHNSKNEFSRASCQILTHHHFGIFVFSVQKNFQPILKTTKFRKHFGISFLKDISKYTKRSHQQGAHYKKSV